LLGSEPYSSRLKNRRIITRRVELAQGLCDHRERKVVASSGNLQSFSPVLSTARNVALFLGRPFRWSATQNVIAFVRLDLHVRDEGEHEFDQLIHASFSSLFQLEKALEAHQSLVYFGAELDTTIEASLFLVVRHWGHHFFLVEVYHNPLLFLTNPTGRRSFKCRSSVSSSHTYAAVWERGRIRGDYTTRKDDFLTPCSIVGATITWCATTSMHAQTTGTSLRKGLRLIKRVEIALKAFLATGF